MTEVTHTGSGQKITTYYTKEEKRDLNGALTGDTRKPGESRVEQNRRLREESRALVSGRPDSRENVEKETKRRKEAHETIDRDITAIRYRQEAEEEEEHERKRSKKPKSRREPVSTQIGSKIPAALRGMQVTSPPPWLYGGSNRLPSWASGGSGKLPPWFSGMGTTPSSSGKKSKKKLSGNGLPEWFRY